MEEKEKEPNNIRVLKKRKPDLPFPQPYSSRNKMHLGSIPGKDEKILLPDPENKSLLKGFSSHSERINPVFEGNRMPGIGEYDLLNSVQSSGSFSHLGYLSGFISNKKRWKGYGSYLNCETTPCPGEYNAAKTSTIEYISKKSLIGQSLYNAKKTKSKKQHMTSPDPFTYSPNKYDNWKLVNKNYRYNFDSSPGRFNLKDERLKYPSPCDYFKTDNNEKNKMIDFPMIVFESLTDVNLKKQKDLKRMSIKTEQEKDDMNFLLRNAGMNPNLESHIIKNEDAMMMKHEMPNFDRLNIDKKRYNDIVKKFEFKEGSMPLIKFKIEEEKELKYIKEVLGNDNARPDMFYLASPRWKESKYKLKVPGPAYYVPKDSRIRYSYNRSNKEFIRPNGPEFN